MIVKGSEKLEEDLNLVSIVKKLRQLDIILQNSLLKDEKRKLYVEHAYQNVINIDDEIEEDYPRGELSNGDSSPTDFRPTFSIKKTASMASKGRNISPEKCLSDYTPRNIEEFEGGKDITGP
jgi:hypothetical protein